MCMIARFQSHFVMWRASSSSHVKQSVLLAVILGVAVSVSAHAQGAKSSASGLLQRVEASESVAPAEAAPGDSVVLRLSIKPDRGIRVFAPGAKEYTPVVVLVSSSRGMRLGKPSYGIPVREENPGNGKRMPLYARTFDISYTARIDKEAKPETYIRVSGTLTYQACDDRRVYPTRTQLVHWTVKVVAPTEKDR